MKIHHEDHIQLEFLNLISQAIVISSSLDNKIKKLE